MMASSGNDPKQARLWVARLGPRGDGADLHVAKTQAPERVNAASFFIKASGEADAVGEGEAHALDRSRFGSFGE